MLTIEQEKALSILQERIKNKEQVFERLFGKFFENK